MTKHAAARGFELIMMMQMAMMRMTMRMITMKVNFYKYIMMSINYNDEQSQWPGLGGEQRTLLKPAGWAGLIIIIMISNQ